MTLVASLSKQHARFFSLLEHVCQCLQVRLLLYLVLHKLNCNQHALSSHVSQNWTSLSNPPKLALKISPYFLRFLSVVFFLEDIEHFHAESALQRPSCKGGEVVVGKCICDFPASGYSGERNTITDGFGHDDDVRFHLLPLEPPRLLANPTETSLHLI